VKQFVTRSELVKFGSEIALNERRQIRDDAVSRSTHGATFLSHSTKDDELVDGAILILRNHGAIVYLDKVDPEMPPYTNDETAETLKTRISQCNKFVLLASKNSKESHWVPWELGIADGEKGMGKIAVFPAVESPLDTNWTTWEYIGIYRKIIFANLEGFDKPLWIVWNKKENSGVALSIWLSK